MSRKEYCEYWQSSEECCGNCISELDLCTEFCERFGTAESCYYYDPSDGTCTRTERR